MQLVNIHITGFSPISHHFSLFDFTNYSYFFSNNALSYSGLFSGSNIIIDEGKCIYTNELVDMFFTRTRRDTRIAVLYRDKNYRDYLMQLLLRSPEWRACYDFLKNWLSNRVPRSCATSFYGQFDIYPIVLADCSIGLCILNFEPQQDYFCIRAVGPIFGWYDTFLGQLRYRLQELGGPDCVMRTFVLCLLVPTVIFK